MDRAMSYRALVVFLVLAIGVAGTTAAQAYCDKSFVISNESDLTMVGLWVSPTGSSIWQDNLLSNDQVGSRMQTVIATSTDIRSGSQYDVRVVWVGEDGTLYKQEHYQVDFCKVARLHASLAHGLAFDFEP